MVTIEAAACVDSVVDSPVNSLVGDEAQGHSPPPLVLRRAPERFHSQSGWLDSWHSFSFAGHYDPRWCGFGPLLVINDDRIAPGQGFGMHPHHDMEIITVMVEGSLHHRDSMGHHATLLAGEVQRMSAGTGLVHSEFNGSEAPCRLLQIWIEPSRPGLTPSYEQRAYPQTGDWTTVIDPQGRHGAMAIQRPVRLWRACPGPGAQLALPLGPGRLGWIQVIAGSLAVQRDDDPSPANQASLSMAEGDGLGFHSGQIAHIMAGGQGADLLLFELD